MRIQTVYKSYSKFVYNDLIQIEIHLNKPIIINKQGLKYQLIDSRVPLE